MMHQVKGEVTDKTWARLCDDTSTVFGLGCFEHTEMQGFVHYVLHPTTGALNPVCYMQDLFIHPDHRRKGLAREILKTLAITGQQNRWERIYWIASQDNAAAQKLYKNIGVQLNFSFHVLPLHMEI